jgi:hypothetical protein
MGILKVTLDACCATARDLEPIPVYGGPIRSPPGYRLDENLLRKGVNHDPDVGGVAPHRAVDGFDLTSWEAGDDCTMGDGIRFGVTQGIDALSACCCVQAYFLMARTRTSGQEGARKSDQSASDHDFPTEIEAAGHAMAEIDRQPLAPVLVHKVRP